MTAEENTIAILRETLRDADARESRLLDTIDQLRERLSIQWADCHRLYEQIAALHEQVSDLEQQLSAAREAYLDSTKESAA